MRLILCLALVAACEKSGSSSTARAPEAAKPAPRPLPDANAATQPPKDDDVTHADADLGQQVQDRGTGGNVVVGGGTGRATRGNGDPRLGIGQGPRIDGPDDRVGADAVSTAPAGRIAVASKQAHDESTLTVDAVLTKIQSSYMAGIKRCYKNHLKMDPTARGKLKIAFTVNATGRAINVKAIGFAKPIDDCFVAQMGSWRFPIPKDKDGEATDASFDFNLNLVPD